MNSCYNNSKNYGCYCCNHQKPTHRTVWLQASSSISQLIESENIPQPILIDNFDSGRGISLDPFSGSIKILESGRYFIIAAPQVGNTCLNNSNFRCWFNVNGIPVANSNVLMQINNSEKDVIVTQGILDLENGDILQVMMASNTSQCVSIEVIDPPSLNEPIVPSIIFTMYKI